MAGRLVDLAFAGFLFGLSIFLWFVADGFPESRRFAQADADYWPKVIFGAMALITGVMVARGLFTFTRRGGGDSPGFVMTPEILGSVVRVAAMAALIILYFFGFQYFGFIVSTFAFLVLASFVIPYRNHLIRVGFAAIFTVVLVLFFTQALQLPLPRGVGAFYDFNLLFY